MEQDLNRTIIEEERSEDFSIIQIAIEEGFFFFKDLLLRYNLKEDEISALSVKEADEQLFEKRGWDEIFSLNGIEHYNYCHYYAVLGKNVMPVSIKTSEKLENNYIVYRKSVSVREGISSIPKYIIECKRIRDKVSWTVYFIREHKFCFLFFIKNDKIAK